AVSRAVSQPSASPASGSRWAYESQPAQPAQPSGPVVAQLAQPATVSRGVIAVATAGVACLPFGLIFAYPQYNKGEKPSSSSAAIAEPTPARPSPDSTVKPAASTAPSAAKAPAAGEDPAETSETNELKDAGRV